MKTYLGDAVYAAVDRAGCIVLTTEDGIRATNTIILDPEVWIALKAHVEHASDEPLPEEPTESEKV